MNTILSSNKYEHNFDVLSDSVFLISWPVAIVRENNTRGMRLLRRMKKT